MSDTDTWKNCELAEEIGSMDETSRISNIEDLLDRIDELEAKLEAQKPTHDLLSEASSKIEKLLERNEELERMLEEKKPCETAKVYGIVKNNGIKTGGKLMLIGEDGRKINVPMSKFIVNFIGKLGVYRSDKETTTILNDHVVEYNKKYGHKRRAG